MQKQPNQQAQQVIQQGADAMRRGDFRYAELAFRHLAGQGQGGLSVGANLGLSLIYQQRWWNGVTQLYSALKALPEDQRKAHLAQVKQGLEHLAGSLEKRRLTGDAADSRRLAKALDPLPRGLVTLAARWLPELSQTNQTQVLIDFVQWLQAADTQWPFAGADIERLARLAARHPANERLLPLLVWGLVQHLDPRQEPPTEWSLAVQGMAALCRSPRVNSHQYTAMAALDLLFRKPVGNFHVAFTDLLSRLLTGDSPLAPEGLDGWSGLFRRLHPELDTLAYEVQRTNALYQIYDVAAAERGWLALWPRLFAEGALDSLGEKELMFLLGEIGFLLTNRSDSLEERQRLNHALSARLTDVIAHKADGEGLAPLRPVQDAVGPGSRPMRIGYLTHTVKAHSVGYLLDVLLRHHSTDVEVYLYDTAILDVAKDEVGKAIVARAAQYRNVPLADIRSGHKAARQMREDGIQLLVDLDGLTQVGHLFVHYFRPAPVSCVYMGFEPCGVPFVDFFLVDPHALPEDAGEYLTEQPYRLPRYTYVPGRHAAAADPDTREEVRARLEIPEGAVVYMIAAPGRKLGAEIAEDVAGILRGVPDGIIVVKGQGNLRWMERFWKERVAHHGVDPQRVRLVPFTPLNAHRAQLRAADVVLDTFPFNGGMHSFENLWLGNPVVTRYGESYFSRITYSMLKNLGIEETIAASREEYREKAIRLGRETALREEIRGRLLTAVREQSGIWDTAGLMRELEAGYRGMLWAKLAPDASGV